MANTKTKTKTEEQEVTNEQEVTSESCTGATDIPTSEDTDGAEGKDTDGADETPVQLIAVSSILFESHMYKPGDVLPAHNAEMNAAWIDAGTAEWRKVNVTKSRKGVPVSATAGLPGSAVPSTEQDLVGRVPGRGRAR